MVPDRLTLAEMLTQFRQAHEDFADIVNEYSLVVGVITLNDVMSTVMGSIVAPHDEEQILRREDGSFLADGLTLVTYLQRVLDLTEWPMPGQYDTLPGFLTVTLRLLVDVLPDHIAIERYSYGQCRWTSIVMSKQLVAAATPPVRAVSRVL